MGDLQQEDLFAVPWGHHRLIIDRCKDDYGKAASLPAPQSDLAQEMTKDPYNFDFLTMIFCFTIFGFTAMWLWK